jgi:hypothetical protein
MIVATVDIPICGHDLIPTRLIEDTASRLDLLVLFPTGLMPWKLQKRGAGMQAGIIPVSGRGQFIIRSSF